MNNKDSFQPKDYLKMDSMTGDTQGDLDAWRIRGLLMGKDIFPSMAYAPAIPMTIETLLTMRAN